MKPLWTRVLVSFAACSLAAAAAAWGQETTSGSLAGRVVDAQNLAVPGATVTVSSDQGARTYVTDAEGRFFAPYLTPGAYTVRVELQGFRPVEQQNVGLRLGQRLELALVLPVGGLEEQVEVIASSPVVDTSSTTTGARLDSEVLNRVPVGRRFTDVLYIAPGVSSGGGTGAANASISGGSGLENNYIIDGVNISDAGYGAAGSYSTTFKTLGNAITFDFVDEVQVKTAGFEAEFGQSTGGIVNVLTKSGSNLIKGSVFSYIRPDAIESSWDPLTSVNGYVNTTATQVTEVGFTLGGPIVKDRLFFFGAMNPQWERTTLIAPAGFALASLGEVDRERRIMSYSGKVTFQMSTQHRFDVSFFGDPSHGKNGPQRADSLLRIDTAGFSELDAYGGNNQAVRYDAILSPRWFVEASFGRSVSALREVPSVNEWTVTDTSVTPTRRYGGIGRYESENAGERLQYKVTSTHLFGNHHIRVGGIYEDIAFDAVTQVTGPTFTLPNGLKTVTGAAITVLPDPVYGKVYRVTSGYVASTRATQQDYYAAFAQDTFKVGERVTVRAGVRWEQSKHVGVGAKYTFPGTWSPRLGITYDPTGKGRAKIYANFGHFYTLYPGDLSSRGFSALAATNQADFFDAQLARPIPDGVLAGNSLNHVVMSGLDPAQAYSDTENTYNREWLVGAEYEWIPGLNLSVRYIRRDLFNVVEDMAPATRLQLVTGEVRDLVFTIGNPKDGWPPTADPRAAHEEFFRQYDAVEFFADKRLADKWSLQASYRWSRLYGDYEGFYVNDFGQSDPGLTALADQPINDPTFTEIGAPRFGWTGDIRNLGRQGAGPLPNDRTHQVKLFGSYGPVGGLNLGTGFLLGSGKPLTAYGSYRSPLGPRGSGIQTTDGLKKRTPVEFSFDFHADYALNVGRQQLLLLADVFNLFNRQGVLFYNQNTERSVRNPNVDYGIPTALQDPRQVRIGVRFQF
jgi:hypothetical protein